MTRWQVLRGAGLGAAGAVSLMLFGQAATAAAHGSAAETAMLETPSDGLRSAMRKLWEDHITWTRLVIVSASAGLPDLNAAVQRLLQNQADIGNAIKPFYGDAAGEKLIGLLKEHITTAADLLFAAKAGDAAKVEKAKAAWYTNADDIATFLSSANPDHWPLDDTRSTMRGHLDLTLEEAVARLRGDWTADVAAYEKIHSHILALADTLAMGIVKQFPEKFVPSPPEVVMTPDLRGLGEQEALQRIDQAGLAATFNNQQTVDRVAPEARDFFLSMSPGQVVSQIPAPGARVLKGTRVHLAVRKA